MDNIYTSCLTFIHLGFPMQTLVLSQLLFWEHYCAVDGTIFQRSASILLEEMRELCLMEHLLLEVLKLAWPGPSEGLNNLSQHLSFPDFFGPSALWCWTSLPVWTHSNKKNILAHKWLCRGKKCDFIAPAIGRIAVQLYPCCQAEGNSGISGGLNGLSCHKVKFQCHNLVVTKKKSFCIIDNSLVAELLFF